MTSSLHVLISEDKRVRARIARMDSVVAEALTRHAAAPLAAHAIARALTATALFPWEWKAGDVEREERIAVQWSGRGKLGTLVCELREPARLRVMVSRPEATGAPLVDANGRARNTGFTDGYVSVLSQDANGRVTQGMVDLVDGNLDTDLERYFTQSQQVATHLRVFVATEGPVRALGVLVQALPDNPPDFFANFSRLDSLTPESSIDDAMTAAFGGEPAKILQTVTPTFSCPCSRERIERSLRLFDVEALEDMIATDHGAEVTCEFCREHYAFDEGELAAVIQDKQAFSQKNVQ